MISKDELEKIKDIRKTSLYYAEKEYLQYIFLNAISKFGEDFIFKGGTCLRIAYSLERASEDLDFSTKLTINEIKKKIYASFKHFDYLNIKYEIYSEKMYEGNLRIEARFYGPLYNNDKRTTNTIKLDFNKRITYKKNPLVIKKMFSDIPPFVLVVMEKSEILAEKIRALTMRHEVRDLYDAWFLLALGEKIDKKLLTKKLNEDKIHTLNITTISEKEYTQGLKILLKNVPDYKKVKELVEKNLKTIKN